MKMKYEILDVIEGEYITKVFGSWFKNKERLQEVVDTLNKIARFNRFELIEIKEELNLTDNNK